MKNTLIAFVVLAIVGFGTYYFVFKTSSDTPSVNEPQTYTPPKTQTNAQTNVTPPKQNTPKPITQAPATVAVNISNFAFSPASVAIKKGTKVTWTNNDSVPHTVTSDSSNILNSGTLAPGQSFSFTFTNAGSVSYHCNIHPTMKGSVVVQN